MMRRPTSSVDFHCHTNRSDGLHPPASLFDQMAGLDLTLVAITDHDTLAGFRELTADGSLEGRLPQVIPGVEINSVADHVPGLPEGELHILGLGVDPASPRLEAALARQRSDRSARIAMIMERLAQVGAPIDDFIDHVPDDRAAIGRPHLGRALVAAGHAGSLGEAFDRYLSPDRPAYVPRIGMTAREAIDLIRWAGGLPVLAHFPLALQRPEIIAELVEWGLLGLEVYYSKFSPAVVDEMAALAARYGLLASAGTDYHGDSGTYAQALARIDPPDGLEDRILKELGRLSAVA